MTPKDFVFWLQGYFEISNPDNLALEQIQVIRDHLSLVLDKQTLNRDVRTISEEDLIEECKNIITEFSC